MHMSIRQYRILCIGWYQYYALGWCVN